MENLFLPQGNETWPENAKEKKNLATIYIESLFYFDLKNKMLIMKENWRKSMVLARRVHRSEMRDGI